MKEGDKDGKGKKGGKKEKKEKKDKKDKKGKKGKKGKDDVSNISFEIFLRYGQLMKIIVCVIFRRRTRVGRCNRPTLCLTSTKLQTLTRVST